MLDEQKNGYGQNEFIRQLIEIKTLVLLCDKIKHGYVLKQHDSFEAKSQQLINIHNVLLNALTHYDTLNSDTPHLSPTIKKELEEYLKIKNKTQAWLRQKNSEFETSLKGIIDEMIALIYYEFEPRYLNPSKEFPSIKTLFADVNVHLNILKNHSPSEQNQTFIDEKNEMEKRIINGVFLSYLARLERKKENLISIKNIAPTDLEAELELFKKEINRLNEQAEHELISLDNKEKIKKLKSFTDKISQHFQQIIKIVTEVQNIQAPIQLRDNIKDLTIYNLLTPINTAIQNFPVSDIKTAYANEQYNHLINMKKCIEIINTINKIIDTHFIRDKTTSWEYQVKPTSNNKECANAVKDLLAKFDGLVAIKQNLSTTNQAIINKISNDFYFKSIKDWFDTQGKKHLASPAKTSTSITVASLFNAWDRLTSDIKIPSANFNENERDGDHEDRPGYFL